MIPTGRAAEPTPDPRPSTPGVLPRPRLGPDGTEAATGGTTTVASRLAPYLTFRDGRAGEAMEFYRSVLGGELVRTSHGDARLETPAGLTLLGAEECPGQQGPAVGGRVSLSLSASHRDAEQVRAWFAGLAHGGAVTRPLEVTAHGDEVGTVVDRYGVTWRVGIAADDADEGRSPG
ncbi:glyoxalase/bleomycin resistance/extradiol dioxygenase family protein [Nocardioides sp. SYSU D00065]|uniref:VOC family protein n=1 Tax=Nocardioides sp. SYSU D00065 TaxID=2817378 RepID=UPI001B319E69|nr:VOC family protein [Nocardioides sp. SYSU D00065]